MAGSSCDANRAEPSQEQSIDTPVLNAQGLRHHGSIIDNVLSKSMPHFVQLGTNTTKNHPDELWEDGLRDYLAHASNIMEKFSDLLTGLK
ncbi:hypothetical protein Pyn_19586 [Prunus yedoensis var. nudiflora]|uniref:Uncharacterized protein n=1 Tax=Prunus yedoensis var. nudiflora TaxID=2094558 RepID=A0A315AJ28_PRUYE|nr:hypothetical protein Pyn_19586 [Prunus yedoensis var. nudiflora]